MDESETVYSYLNTLLKTAPSLQSNALNAVLFGEEHIYDENRKPPAIVVVPMGGPIGMGTAPKGLDPEQVNMIWETSEMIHVHCWGKSYAKNANSLDHYNATDLLRQNVLKAFQFQRYDADPEDDKINDGPGYWFKPVNGYWVTYGDSVTRYGRAYVIEIEVKILIIDDTSDETENVDGINISQMIIEED